MIHDDTPCSRCGYSLRTLRRDGNCPECGQPVARSLMRVDERELLKLEDALIERADGIRHRRLVGMMIGWGGVIGFVVLAYFLSRSGALAHPPSLIGLFGGWILLSGILTYTRICRAHLQHVDYVLHSRQSGDATRDARQRRRDNRILRNMDRHRRNSRASGCLFAMMASLLILVGGMMLSSPLPSDPTTRLMILVVFVSGINCCATTLIGILENRVLLNYARSIEYYRKNYPAAQEETRRMA